MQNPAPTSMRRLTAWEESVVRHFTFLHAPAIKGVWITLFAALFAGATLSASNGGGPRAIFTFFGALAIMVGLFPNAVVKGNARNALLWAYPLWTVLSIGWSVDSARTLHSVLLVVPTIVAGLALGGSRAWREVNLGVTLAMGLFIAAAVATSGHTGFTDTGSGGDALTGFGTGKNYFGHLAAMSVILSLSFFSFADTRFGKLAVLLGMGDFVVSTYALLGAHATGSTLSCVIALLVVAVVVSFSRVSWQVRVLMLASLVGVLVIYAVFGEEIQKILFETVLKQFNKDTSLTGRTTLWDYADRLMEDHRMLGYGYGTFWQVTNPDAWALWRMMGVQPNSGFNFHNTMRETMIECGLIGFVIFAGTYGWALVRTFLASLPKGDLAAGIRLGFVVYFIVRMPVESTGFGAVTFDTIVLLAFLSVPLRVEAQPRATSGAIRQRLARRSGRTEWHLAR